MVPEPRTFKELVEADLRRAARLIIKVQDEVDPQFRIATPDRDYATVTLSRDPRERMMMLRRVSAFMAWKKGMGFILARVAGSGLCVRARRDAAGGACMSGADHAQAEAVDGRELRQGGVDLSDRSSGAR